MRLKLFTFISWNSWGPCKVNNSFGHTQIMKVKRDFAWVFNTEKRNPSGNHL